MMIKGYFKYIRNEDRSVAEGRPAFDKIPWVEQSPDRYTSHGQPIDDAIAHAEFNVRRLEGEALNPSNPNVKHLAKLRELRRRLLEQDVVPSSGVPLEEWPAITRAQLEQAQFAGIRTVEDLAASDADDVAQKVDGGALLHARAVAWLDHLAGVSDADKTAELKAQVAALQAQLSTVTRSYRRAGEVPTFEDA